MRLDPSRIDWVVYRQQLFLLMLLFGGVPASLAWSNPVGDRSQPNREQSEISATQLCETGRKSNMACGSAEAESRLALGDYRGSNFKRREECQNNLHAGNDYTPEDPVEVRALNGRRARYTSACLATYAKMEEITEDYYEKRRNGCRTIQADLQKAQSCVCGPAVNQKTCIKEAEQIFQRVGQFEQEMGQNLSKAGQEMERLMERNKRALDQYNADRIELNNPVVNNNRQRVAQLLNRGYADSIEEYRNYIDSQAGEQQRAGELAQALRQQIETATREHQRQSAQFSSMASALGTAANPSSDMSTITGDTRGGTGALGVGNIAPLMGPAMGMMAAAQKNGSSGIGATSGASVLGSPSMGGGSQEGGKLAGQRGSRTQSPSGGASLAGLGSQKKDLDTAAQRGAIGSALEGIVGGNGGSVGVGEQNRRDPASLGAGSLQALSENNSSSAGSRAAFTANGAASRGNPSRSEAEGKKLDELQLAKSFSQMDLGSQTDLANGDLTAAMSSLAEELGADLSSQDKNATFGEVPPLVGEDLLAGLADPKNGLSQLTKQSNRVIQGEEGEPLFKRIREAHIRSAKRGLLVLGHRNKLQ
jgi:hypothetical protein